MGQMRNDELLISITAMQYHVDMQSRDAVEALSVQLESRAFDLAKLSPQDMAELYVALHTIPNLRSNQQLAQSLSKLLALRVSDAPLEALSKIVQTLKFLPPDAAAEIRHTFQSGVTRLFKPVMDEIAQAVLAKNPKELSAAVDRAKAFSDLAEVCAGHRANHYDPQQMALQKLMTRAMDKLPGSMVKDFEEIFTGKKASVKTLAAGVSVKTTRNAVKSACERHVDEVETQADHETMNLQLVRRAVANSFAPPWEDSTKDGGLRFAQLFGGARVPRDERVVGDRGHQKLPYFVEMIKDLEGRDPLTPEDAAQLMVAARVPRDLVHFLQTLEDIDGRSALSQEDAIKLMAPLQVTARSEQHDLRVVFGSEQRRPGWDLSQLENLRPEERHKALCRLPGVVEARVVVQRAVLAKVNMALFQAGKEAARRERLNNVAAKPPQLNLPAGSSGKQVTRFALPEVQDFMRPFPSEVRDVLLSLDPAGASYSGSSQFVKINNAFTLLEGFKNEHPELAPVLTGWVMQEAIRLLNPDERSTLLASLEFMPQERELPSFLKNPQTLEMIKELLRPAPATPATAV